MSRNTLGLSPRKQNILANEDKLLQIAAGELIPDEPIEEPEAPRLDEKAPYAQVCGDEGAAFIQGKNYFDRSKRLLREAPEAAWYIVAPAPTVTEKIRAAATREVLSLSNVPRVPTAVAEAEKENAQALAAEKLAE